MGPIEPSERIAAVDVLRGIAIFGIFIVNLQMFNGPMSLFMVNPHYWLWPPDDVAMIVIQTVFQGKFYTMFSFLFGLGLAIQLSRAEARGARFAALYSRRLLVLLAIGTLHAFLVWYGDILMTYAVFGFVLMLFRTRSEKAILVWMLALLVFPLLLFGSWVTVTQLHVIPDESAKMLNDMRASVVDAFKVYPNGSWTEIFIRRAKDVADIWRGTGYFGAHILAMFLIGLYAGRRRVLESVDGNPDFIRRVRNWTLIPGVIGSIYSTWAGRVSTPMLPTWFNLGSTLSFIAGNTCLSLFYMSVIVLMCRDERWRTRLARIASAGRMALSNYLFQSLLMTTLLYSYGLKLYGKISPAIGFVLVILVYRIQMRASHWWLKRFRFGPAEWLWRSLTYRQWQRMREA